MPELPEVETVRRGIAPYIVGRSIKDVIVRDRRLRWPVTAGLKKKCSGSNVTGVDRRGKYLLLSLSEKNEFNGTLLIHLGMSGRLRIIPDQQVPKKHDHVDFIFEEGLILRYTDPRRFGAVLWVKGDPLQHKLLATLGPEPLEKSFDARYLLEKASHRKVCVKSFIMDSHIVVGVGNIYANEALFDSGIHPLRESCTLTLKDWNNLVKAIKKVLKFAIKAGGTTLRDFVSAEGKSGYFQQELSVYGRGSMPCVFCKSILKEVRVGQRSTVYCPRCQI